MEILADSNPQGGDAVRELYDASLTGNVSILKSLIQRDPLILSRVSLYPFSETPLHIASLLGHLEFCQVLLHINPSSASEVNSEGRCPLHLASANGHAEVVKALLLTNSQTCLIREKDDKLPLHFAAMRGRIGAIEELISAYPETIREVNETGDGSILHLCVRYNHLEALKLFVESVRGDNQFLTAKDKEGNTVLQLAVKSKQIKIVRYLLSISELSTTMNNLSSSGLTPLDMLELYPRDTNATIIEHNLIEEGAQGSANTVVAQQPISQTPLLIELQPMSSQSIVTPQQDPVPSSSNNPSQPEQPPSTSNNPPQPPSTSNNPPQPPQPSPSYYPQSSQPNNNPVQVEQLASNTDPPPSTGPLQPNTANEQHECSRWDIFENFCKTYLINQGNWLDRKAREQLIVAATVIATMTFQAVISPPGGVWQSDTTNGSYTCPDFGFCEAGTAVVGYVWSPDFLKFIFFNSASFFASLCVVLVLISGFPLGNKVIMWVLTLLMIIAITCMLLTYMWALGLVSPNHIFYRIRGLSYILVGIWSFLLFIVCLIQIIRVVLWVKSRGRSSTDTTLTTQNSTSGLLNN